MIHEKIYLKKNFPLLIISATIAILGLLALSYVTRFGAGITYDSIFYIIGGKNIFQGNGKIRQLTGHPALHLS